MAPRKRFAVTEEMRAQVQAMTGFGLTRDQIAAVLGKSEATIKRHFKKELATGKLKAMAKVAESLYMIATKGKGSPQVSAAIFWLRTQGRWTSVENVNVNMPQEGGHLADLRNLTSEELRALEQISRHLETRHRPEEPAANRIEGEPNGLPPLN